MNRKEWKLAVKEKQKGIWEFRNKAVKYFNLQKGEVIHHLRDTEEQRIFNDTYYERWGFDLNGEMKYAVKWDAKKHIQYHSSSIIHKKLSSQLITKYNKSLKGKSLEERLGYEKAIEVKRKISLKSAGKNNGMFGKKQSENTKLKQKEKALNRTKEQIKIAGELSGKARLGKKYWTNGQNLYLEVECPKGCWKYKRPFKARKFFD